MPRTARWLTPLGVCALAVLLVAALVAAACEPDAPTTAPAPTATPAPAPTATPAPTPTATPAPAPTATPAPAPTATTAPAPTATTAPAPTATTAPAPTATTAPVFRQSYTPAERVALTALTALYRATDGGSWSNNANWLSDKPIGRWHGVQAVGDGRVIGLDLSDNNLSGEMPSELGKLANLTLLRLSGNQLIGELPPELGNLAGLRWLHLQENLLSGEIPPELGNLTNLEQMWLQGNQLSGELPPEFGNLFSLQVLRISETQLSGCVPFVLEYQLEPRGYRYMDSVYNSTLPPPPYDGGLPFCAPPPGPGSPETDREALVAFYNATDGENWTNNTNWLSAAPIDQWRGVRTDDNGRVTWIFLPDNQLRGELPPELGRLGSLQGLFLGGNQLSGELPSELGDLANLKYLSLSDNELSGGLPPALGKLASLRELWLDNNQVIGELPPELDGLVRLQVLYLQGDPFIRCGSVTLGLVRRFPGRSIDIGGISYCAARSYY